MIDRNLMSAVVSNAVTELVRRKQAEAYHNDPVLWADYMLGTKLWSKQREVSLSVVQNKSTAVKAGHGLGKLVAENTPILTVNGWVNAGDLSVGDTLFDEAGQRTSVVAKSEVWDQVNYVITFDDGSTIEAGENHEWNVLDLSRRTAAMKRGVADWRDHWDDSVTMTTQELFDSGTKTNSGQGRWRIPLAQPLQMPEADLPVDPYVLGFWLGDGSSNTGGITYGRLKDGLLGIMDGRGYDTRVKDIPVKNSSYATSKRLARELDAAGLLNNKHIPVQYLVASESQRRELLAGLMDSDGFLMKAEGGASVGIDMTNKRLSEDIYSLLMTLGCKVFWSEGVAAYTLNNERTVTGTRYRMNWTPLENPFKIRGQGWAQHTTQRSRHTVRTVVSIEEKGRLQNFCIQVDSPRNLYLAGKSLIPTHNSYLVAVLIVWWVDTRYPNAFVASTAPSQKQIGAIVWREVRKLYALIKKRHAEGVIDHELPGYITMDNEWKTSDGSIIGFGRKPPDNKEGDMFQGIHGNVLAVGDEAVGLSEDMIGALGDITSNDTSRRILIANPTNPASHFGKIFKEDTGAWSLHTISVLDSPNFTDEQKEMPPEALEMLTGPDYVEEKTLEYGSESARFRARVLGEFAWDIGNALIRPEDIAAGVDNDIFVSEYEKVILGVDVARYGSDSSVIYKNTGGEVRFVQAWEKSPVTRSAEIIHQAAIDHHASQVRIDSLGIGGGVIDVLLARDDVKYEIIAMNSSQKSPDKKRWHNARAWWWDSFREGMVRGEISIDFEDEKLQDELPSVEYKFNNTSGGLVIESKDDMRSRGQKSPDYADAAIFAAADISVLIDLGPQPGDKFQATPEQLLEEVPAYFSAMAW